MDDARCLEHTLELVAQRVGDPAPLVFARLFAEAPELQALFCNDTSGAVRAEMFLRAIECLQDAAGPGRASCGGRTSACSAGSRLLVQQAVYEPLLERLGQAFSQGITHLKRTVLTAR